MQIVLASVEDRQQLENEIKSQRKINSRPISATHSMTSSRSSRSYSIDSNHFPNSNSAYSTPLGQGTPISTSALSHSTRHPMRSTASAQEVSLDQLMHSIMSGMQTHSAAIESIADFGDAESLEQLMILQVSLSFLFDSCLYETNSFYLCFQGHSNVTTRHWKCRDCQQCK